VNRALSTGEYFGETKQRLEKAKSRTDETVRDFGFTKFCG
jgi:hypothetical protein